MNKGLAIGVPVVIAIAAIAGAYAFFGIQENGPSDESSGIGVKDTAEVEITAPEEEQEALPGESAEFGIRDFAEVEVVDPEEEESPDPPNVTISVEERIGFKTNP